jgi:Zn-dependent protease
MMQSYKIGTFRKIEVKIHSSFAIAIGWVIYHFGWSTGGGFGGVVYGLVLMTLVFGCVILHEFGHSLMAQEYGVKVRNITLFPFGGAAFIEQMPIRSRSEMLITIAGPVVNVAIAFALLPIIVLMGIFNGSSSVGDYIHYLDEASLGGLIVYLFFANVTLFLFNLLPAFPMDGGRLIRAALASVMSRERSTAIAVGLGVAAAIAMFIAGVWLRDFALPLVAIFILVAAYGENKAVRMESSLRRLRVGQFALWDSGGIPPTSSLASALRGGPRDLVVTDDGRVIGMLWRNDVLRELNGGAGHRTVAEFVDRDFTVVHVDDSVFDVQQLMQQKNRWAVPVIENGLYRGIFTVDRILHVYRQLHAQSPEQRVVGWATEVGNVLRGGVR